MLYRIDDRFSNGKLDPICDLLIELEQFREALGGRADELDELEAALDSQLDRPLHVTTGSP